MQQYACIYLLPLTTLEEGCCSDTIGPVPEAAVTVLCTPDDGSDGHPKHIE
jgi:hypothetical protein